VITKQFSTNSFLFSPVSYSKAKYNFDTIMCDNAMHGDINKTQKERLEKLKENINKYIENPPPVAKGIQSNVPIKAVNFDKIFLNIFNIHTIYTTNTQDRIVVILNNNEKYVYYPSNKDEIHNICQLINVIPNNVKVLVITDIKNTFENSFHFLYCENKNNSI